MHTRYCLSSFPSHQSKFAKQFRQFANIYSSYSGAGRTRYLIHNSLDNFARLGTVIILTDVFEFDFRQTGLQRLLFKKGGIRRHHYLPSRQMMLSVIFYTANFGFREYKTTRATFSIFIKTKQNSRFLFKTSSLLSSDFHSNFILGPATTISRL